ncbi:MAG: tRNA lysidine(34) synthetase TilS [Planctomycetes bacterium]|nr:tRNA lysidine(34) synthetase TilS [Planctomycetota bacterium]MCB9826224.1 tRNA lysidine(34) synthetase TilS [Planctomycetota bacterium]MCB9829571.1 tRNA lysidine(34) synthetase TilS [Planctomycetota bacterium]MCB9902226.1 tRNA lysidine(34) synthetase TilS [Planctomycetota bacterium]
MDTAPKTPGQLVDHVRSRLLALAPEAGAGFYVVAVSGGADSSALAIALARGWGAEAGRRLALAHVAHGWHDAETARRERNAVNVLAHELRLPVAHPPAPWHGPALRQTEDAARRWRYATLERFACRLGARFVLTGHHQRDQAETVCLRAQRGSGRAGLAGIPPRRALGTHGVEVLRPLLDVDPGVLRELLTAESLPWFTDPANFVLHHDRARLRHARGTSPGTDARIAAFAARQRTRMAARERAAVERLGSALRLHPLASAVEVERAAWPSLSGPLAEAAWRRMGRAIGADLDGPWLTRAHVERLQDAMARGGGVSLPRGVRLHARGPRAWLWRRSTGPSRAWLSTWRGPSGGERVETGAQATARIDARRAGPRPVLRRVQAGDRFRPAGREPDREVDVIAWMKRRGIPAFVRAQQHVVEANGEIAWVVGLRVDRRYLVADDADDVWHLRVGRA